MYGEECFDAVALCRRGGAVEEVFFADGQHAAGPTGGIVNGKMPIGDGDFQQLNHEADDFAWGEVIARLLAALFREAAEQFLVDVTHLERRKLVRSEREFL